MESLHNTMAIKASPCTVVPILGMHRSGTSMLASILSVLGVKLGPHLLPPNLDNPLGFFEDRFFLQTNIALLKFLNCHLDGFDLKNRILSTAGKASIQADREIKMNISPTTKLKL